jgi:hypothetical protein
MEEKERRRKKENSKVSRDKKNINLNFFEGIAMNLPLSAGSIVEKFS